jgi:hypothetical protein
MIFAILQLGYLGKLDDAQTARGSHDSIENWLIDPKAFDGVHDITGSLFYRSRAAASSRLSVAKFAFVPLVHTSAKSTKESVQPVPYLRAAGVRLWHFSDIACRAADVRP